MNKHLPSKVVTKILFILLLLANPLLGKTPAADDFSNLTSILNTSPAADKVLVPSSVLSEKDLRKEKLSSEWRERAEALYETAVRQRLFPNGVLTLADFEQAMRVISCLEKKRPKFSFFSRKKTGQYFLHPDHIFLKIPVQFYNKDKVYLHFYLFDTKSKKGGYKSFSRSLDVLTGEVVANLYTPVSDLKDAKRLLDEVETLRAFTGVNYLMTLRDASVYQAFIEGRSRHMLAFQSPLYAGDLAELAREGLNYSLLVEVARQAALAVQAMHARGYVHGDIKPANFFYKYNNHHDLDVALGDFGLTLHRSSGEIGEHLSGTRGYMDPDLCKKKLMSEPLCRDFAACADADVYSLGISLYELLKGSHNNELSNLTHVINNIAMPKEKYQAPPPASIFAAIARLTAAHARLAPRRDPTLSPTQTRLLHLEELIWHLLHPDPTKRQGLSAFIDQIETLRSLQDLETAA